MLRHGAVYPEYHGTLFSRQICSTHRAFHTFNPYLRVVSDFGHSGRMVSHKDDDGLAVVPVSEIRTHRPSCTKQRIGRTFSVVPVLSRSSLQAPTASYNDSVGLPFMFSNLARQERS
jgi:hypothetical protein